MKDQKTEHFLKDQGVSFTYEPKLPLAQIVEDPQAMQQIRLLKGQADPEQVDRYLRAHEEGSEFPALLLNRTAEKTYSILGGNTRFAMYKKAHVATVDAYICELDPVVDAAVISRVRRTNNSYEGQCTSLEQAVQQGLHLMDEGMAAADAARLLFLSPQRLYTEERYRKSVDRIIKTTGYRTSDIERIIGRHAVIDLGKIPNDELAAKATKLAYEARLNSEEIAELSKQIRQPPTDKGREEIFQRIAEDYKPRIKATAGGRIALPRGSRIRQIEGYAQKIKTLMMGTSRDQLADRDRLSTIRTLKRLIRELEGLVARLEAGSGNGRLSKSTSRLASRVTAAH